MGVPQGEGPHRQVFDCGVEASSLRPGTAIDALLAGLIDYAGLYPPASLDMRPAVENYLAYRGGKHAYTLGRFIVGLNRIEELRAVAGKEMANLRLSLIIPPDCEWARLAALLDQRIPIESIETKGSKPCGVDPIRKRAPAEIELYIELPIASVNEETLRSLGSAGLRLKLRMGGVTPQAFPPAHDVARALAAIAGSPLSFKATAGLHHPLRSRHALTFAQDSPSAIMHGFINLFGAAASTTFGGNDAEAEQILEEQDSAAWNLAPDAICW